MSDKITYILTQDNDCHWYVIPKNKKEAWNDFLEDEEAYEFGDLPDFAIEVGGSPENVEFENYKIN